MVKDEDQIIWRGFILSKKMEIKIMSETTFLREHLLKVQIGSHQHPTYFSIKRNNINVQCSKSLLFLRRKLYSKSIKFLIDTGSVISLLNFCLTFVYCFNIRLFLDEN